MGKTFTTPHVQICAAWAFHEELLKQHYIIDALLDFVKMFARNRGVHNNRIFDTFVSTTNTKVYCIRKAFVEGNLNLNGRHRLSQSHSQVCSSVQAMQPNEVIELVQKYAVDHGESHAMSRLASIPGPVQRDRKDVQAHVFPASVEVTPCEDAPAVTPHKDLPRTAPPPPPPPPMIQMTVLVRENRVQELYALLASFG